MNHNAKLFVLKGKIECQNSVKILCVASAAKEDEDFLYSEKGKTFADAPKLNFVEVQRRSHIALTLALHVSDKA